MKFLFTILILLVCIPAYSKNIKKHQMTGLASIYYPGDGHSGKICADGKKFTKDRCHIAHRTWRLGSKVLVCNRYTKRCTETYIGDRGPYGACITKGLDYNYRCLTKWVLKRKRTDPGYWRGIADLSLCVANKIGHRGLEFVDLYLLSSPKKKGGKKRKSRKR